MVKIFTMPNSKDPEEDKKQTISFFERAKNLSETDRKLCDLIAEIVSYLELSSTMYGEPLKQLWGCLSQSIKTQSINSSEIQDIEKQITNK